MTNASLNEKLLEASKSGTTKEVEKLLDLGADVAHQNSIGYSALALAAWQGKTETCLALLDRGADINAQGGTGYSALALAARYGENQTFLALLGRNADVESKNIDGFSPLALAAVNGETQICLMLIAHGANIPCVLDMPEASHLTESIREVLAFPLHMAASFGMTRECVQMLDLGYDIEQTNPQGKTALHCAGEGRDATHAALRSWLARQEAGRLMEEMTAPKP